MSLLTFCYPFLIPWTWDNASSRPYQSLSNDLGCSRSWSGGRNAGGMAVQCPGSAGFLDIMFGKGLGDHSPKTPCMFSAVSFCFYSDFPRRPSHIILPCQTVSGETDSANFLALLCVAEGRSYVLAREEDSDSMDPLDDFLCDGVSRVCCLLINAVQSRP